MYLIYKCLAGAMIMLALHFLAKSKSYYYLTSLVLLFPIFSLPAYYFIFSNQGDQQVRRTSLFGLSSILAYAGFLLCVFLTVRRSNILIALATATAVWLVLALMILLAWKRWGGV